MSAMHEPTIDTIWRPVCFECGWVGETRPLRSDASEALDGHLERFHPSILVLLKRYRMLEKIASIAFELVPDEEALLCEHSDDDFYCHGCIGDRVNGEHSDGCRSVKLVELRKELGKL